MPYTNRELLSIADTHASESPELTQQLYANGNSAFLDGAAFNSIVPVPVSCDEPLEGVTRAVEVCVDQADQDYAPALAFSINGPSSNPAAVEKIQEVAEAVRLALGCVALPASFYTKLYSPGEALISYVRREIVSAFLGTLSQYPMRNLEEISIIPAEADFVYATPKAFQTMHQGVLSGVPVVRGNTIQARAAQLKSFGLIDEADSLTNMDAVLHWYDLAIAHDPYARQGPPYAVTLPDYLAADGFDRDRRMRENLSLQKRITDQADQSQKLEERLPPELVTLVSPRRMYTALSSGHSPLEAWNVTSFGAYEALRNIRTVIQDGDITEAVAADHITQLQEVLYGYTIANIAQASLGRDSRFRGVPLDMSIPRESRALAEATEKMRRLTKSGQLGLYGYVSEGSQVVMTAL